MVMIIKNYIMMKVQRSNTQSQGALPRSSTVMRISNLLRSQNINATSLMGSIVDYGSMRTFKRIPKKPENLSVTALAAKDRQSKGPLRTKEYRQQIKEIKSKLEFEKWAVVDMYNELTNQLSETQTQTHNTQIEDYQCNLVIGHDTSRQLPSKNLNFQTTTERRPQTQM